MQKNGQSIIEYVLIAVLVILGVVIMGAYVLRSTNAHFKIWDEAVQDTFQEHITQAPQSAVPYIPTNCNCWDNSETCGSYGAGIQCASNERVWGHSCNILGCDGRASSYCQHDDACCLQYFQQACGTLPFHASGVSPTGFTRVTIAANATNKLPGTSYAYYSTAQGTCTANTSCPAGTECTSVAAGGTKHCFTTSCSYGEHTWSTQCADLAVACFPEHACDPTCTGVNLADGSIVFCATGNTSPPAPGTGGLLQNSPVTYVGGGCPTGCSGSEQPAPNGTGNTTCVSGVPSACTGAAPCAGYCNECAGNFPSYAPGTGTIISCINVFNVAPAITTAAYGACAVNGACTQSATTYETWNCGDTDVSWIYGCRQAGKIFQVRNNCSFNICPTEADIKITSVNASPTQLTSGCTGCSCCDDYGSYPHCNSQPDTCAGQTGATPTCQCQVNMTVTSTTS